SSRVGRAAEHRHGGHVRRLDEGRTQIRHRGPRARIAPSHGARRTRGDAPSYALRIESEGKVLTYSGDTEWVEELVPAGRGADLFICEAYFFDKMMKYHINSPT